MKKIVLQIAIVIFFFSLTKCVYASSTTTPFFVLKPEIAIQGEPVIITFENVKISEIKNIGIARKSIHIKNNVSKGDLVTKEDLIMLRPGDGISPMDIDLVINKKYKSNFLSGYKLTLKDLE